MLSHQAHPEAEFMNYNFIEVSGHTLESSQLEVSVWISESIGKCMVFYQVILLSSLQCTVETVRGCVRNINLKAKL
jgi:hypothetical protein